MSQTTLKDIIDAPEYDINRENTLRSMLYDFYNRNMMFIVIFIWSWGLAFMIGLVYCGIRFVHAEQTQAQIMYATLALGCFQGIAMLKVFAWQMIHRNSIKRDIKRLEMRVLELPK